MTTDTPDYYKRPIKAYHLISGGKAALDQVLTQGSILPMAYRADLSQIRDLCEERISTIRSNKASKDALRILLEKELTSMTVGPDWTSKSWFNTSMTSVTST